MKHSVSISIRHRRTVNPGRIVALFRQLGFHRVTAAGHKDKVLEYGKDVWMKFTLTQHFIYFGIQAKKGKLDASGVSKAGNETFPKSIIR